MICVVLSRIRFLPYDHSMDCDDSNQEENVDECVADVNWRIIKHSDGKSCDWEKNGREVVKGEEEERILKEKCLKN